MSTYRVKMDDGRTIDVHSDSGEIAAARQAEHWDKDRYRIAVRRDQDPGPTPTKAVDVERVK